MITLILGIYLYIRASLKISSFRTPFDEDVSKAIGPLYQHGINGRDVAEAILVALVLVTSICLVLSVVGFAAMRLEL